MTKIENFLIVKPNFEGDLHDNMVLFLLVNCLVTSKMAKFFQIFKLQRSKSPVGTNSLWRDLKNIKIRRPKHLLK
jgi:hypothetical protein